MRSSQPCVAFPAPNPLPPLLFLALTALAALEDHRFFDILPLRVLYDRLARGRPLLGLSNLWDPAGHVPHAREARRLHARADFAPATRASPT